MNDYLSIGLLAGILFNLLFTIFLVRRASKETKNVLQGLDSSLQEGIENIREQIDPVIKGNSRAMGAISHLADSTKMDQALERRIGQDLMGEYDDVLEMVKMTFPRVAEYLEERPEALTKLIPRLNSLIGDPEARKRLKLDFSQGKSDITRIWNE